MYLHVGVCLSFSEDVLSSIHADPEYPCELVGTWNTWYGEQDQAGESATRRYLSLYTPNTLAERFPQSSESVGDYSIDFAGNLLVTASQMGFFFISIEYILQSFSSWFNKTKVKNLRFDTTGIIKGIKTQMLHTESSSSHCTLYFS